MSKQTIEEWGDLKDKILQLWGRGLTNEDIVEIEKDRELLYSKLQHLYGYTKNDIDEKLSR